MGPPCYPRCWLLPAQVPSLIQIHAEHDPKLEVPTIYKAYVRDSPIKYGIIWYSIFILGSWNCHWTNGWHENIGLFPASPAGVNLGFHDQHLLKISSGSNQTHKLATWPFGFWYSYGNLWEPMGIYGYLIFLHWRWKSACHRPVPWPKESQARDHAAHVPSRNVQRPADITHLSQNLWMKRMYTKRQRQNQTSNILER